MFGVKLDRYGDEVQFSGNVWPKDNDITLGTASKSWHNAYIRNITGSVLNLTSSTDINLIATGGEITFDDTNRGGSTYSTSMKLTDTSSEWDTFETNFGEVSLLNAINQSGYWDRTGTILSPNTAGDTVRAGAGTPSQPSYAGELDPDTGIQLGAMGRIDLIVAGNVRWYVGTTYFRSPTQYGAYLRATASDAAGPTFSFTSDTNTGMYRKAADELAFSTNATERLSINTALTTSNLTSFDINATGGSSNVKLTANGDADDLTISLAGNYDASLFLTSTGTGTDAIRINASAGSIDIDAANAITLNAADASHFIVTGDGVDLTLETTAGNTYVKGGGEVRFTDGHMTDWAKGYIELSSTGSDWTTYEANFGEVSLMNAISQAFTSFEIYSQAGEPALSDSTAAFWRDTDDDKIRLLFKFTGLTQVSVELT